MRHKLITVGDDAERVAAYPPIRGFADPPYYVGLRPPPIPDDEYDLWEVKIENVNASVTELWVLEHRFRGQATAQGSFVVKPSRWVQVLPGKLAFEAGRLTLGEHLVAERVRGSISCEVPDYDVQAAEGSQVFKEISARIDLQLAGGKLDFLRAYLARLGPVGYSGNGSFNIAAGVEKGRVTPNSRVDVLATPLTLHHPQAQISGDVMLSFGRPESAPPERLALAFNVPRLTTTRRHGVAGPTFDGLRASLLVDAVDLSKPMSLGDGQVALENAHAPSLAWFGASDAQLSGEATGALVVARTADGQISGRAELASPRAGVKKGSFAAVAALDGKLVFATTRDRALDVTELELHLKNATLQSGQKQSQPFALSLTSPRLRIASGAPRAARGNLHLRVSSAEALLPLVMSDMLREIGSSALDLKALEARAHLELQPPRLTLTGIDAHSGNLRLRGHVEQQGRDPSGALLLSSGPLNVGVTLKGGGTEVAPFVGDDWLAPPRSRPGS